MQVDSSLRWMLQLADPGNDNWQSQYTGFDPKLSLPKALNDSTASDFLLAFARFEDGIEALNGQASSHDRPLDALERFVSSFKKSGANDDVTQRVVFNCNLLEDRRGGFISRYATSYLFALGEEFSIDYPSLPVGYKGTVSEQRVQRSKRSATEEVAKAPYEKQKGESWEEYAHRFLELCAVDQGLSSLGFIEYLTDNVKIQYVEPWLLYMGQSLDELVDVCEMRGASDELLQYAKSMKKAYTESGLEEVVTGIRSLANTEQKRVTIFLDRPERGAVSHIKRVGGVIRGQDMIAERIPD